MPSFTALGLLAAVGASAGAGASILCTATIDDVTHKIGIVDEGFEQAQLGSIYEVLPDGKLGDSFCSFGEKDLPQGDIASHRGSYTIENTLGKSLPYAAQVARYILGDGGSKDIVNLSDIPFQFEAETYIKKYPQIE